MFDAFIFVKNGDLIADSILRRKRTERISTDSRDFFPTFFDSNVYISRLVALYSFLFLLNLFLSSTSHRFFPIERDFDRKKRLIRIFLACRQKFLPNFRTRVHFRPLHRYPPVSRSNIPWRCKIIECWRI